MQTEIQTRAAALAREFGADSPDDIAAIEGLCSQHSDDDEVTKAWHGSSKLAMIMGWFRSSAGAAADDAEWIAFATYLMALKFSVNGAFREMIQHFNLNGGPPFSPRAARQGLTHIKGDKLDS